MAYLIIVVVGVIFLLSIMLRVLKEYERGVIFRLGRCIGQKGPGLIILWPVIDQMTRVSTRTIAMDVPPQDIITKDNVSIKVNAVVYFRVINAVKSIIEVENYLYATSQLAQTTLRTILGKHELDDLLSEQEGIAKDLQIKIDKDTDPWGIKVSLVEIKHVDLP
ncbi:slipin family protein, partial [Candidatus Dependentiae bacterium]|nr:slipin family protein [Candidatus Dependentiae bacterium]